MIYTKKQLEEDVKYFEQFGLDREATVTFVAQLLQAKVDNELSSYLQREEYWEWNN